MNYLSIVLGYSVTVGVPEMIIFLLAAVLLGFCIHFYWAGRGTVPRISGDSSDDENSISADDRSRLQFYEQVEKYEKNQDHLEKEVRRMGDAEKMLTQELEEAKEEIKRLESLAEKHASPAESSQARNHLSELMMAQQHLHESLSHEMAERLEKAYEEFNFLHDRLQKMQSQIVDPQRGNFDLEELESAYFRLTKEYDELKLKHIALLEEHQQLERNFADAEEKLRDATFQKQQLQKKVRFLEELTADLQQVTGHQKKLEGQLRRISEIEALLSKSK